ncbi:hypothetical protein ACOMHN_005119 [Nucella lapillus]
MDENSTDIPTLDPDDGKRDDETDSNANKRMLLTREGTAIHCASSSGEISRTDGGRDRVITFNVGGRIFLTRRSTLEKASDKTKGLKFTDEHFLGESYDASRDEYFLDRDPEVFGCVLNFLRSGRLHLPHSLCGPRLREELTYWGVSPLHIEPCCWQTFNSWNSAMASLKRLERDSKLGISPARRNSLWKGGGGGGGGEGGGGGGGRKGVRVSRWQVGRRRVWETLTDPRCSVFAKIYGWIALIFVTFAIFSFCAATHMAFRVPRHSPTTTTMTSINVTNNVTATSSPETVTKLTKKSVEDQFSETEVHPVLSYLDLVCLVFFTMEFLTKLTCAPRRLRYLRSINGIVDLLALCPDFVEMIVVAADPNDLQGESRVLLFLPFLRLMRVFRIFRLVRHVPGLWIMIYTLQASFNELFLMLVFLCVGTLLFSSAIFFVDDKEMFPSIPHGFWWAIVTMTTVGYGDMYPVTPWGYVLGSLTAVSGVLMIGFTVPALVNNFGLYCRHVQFALQRDRLHRQLEKGEGGEEEEEGEEGRGEEGWGVGGWAEERTSDHESIPLRTIKKET